MNLRAVVVDPTCALVNLTLFPVLAFSHCPLVSPRSSCGQSCLPTSHSDIRNPPAATTLRVTLLQHHPCLWLCPQPQQACALGAQWPCSWMPGYPTNLIDNSRAPTTPLQAPRGPVRGSEIASPVDDPSSVPATPQSSPASPTAQTLFIALDIKRAYLKVPQTTGIRPPLRLRPVPLVKKQAQRREKTIVNSPITRVHFYWLESFKGLSI